MYVDETISLDGRFVGASAVIATRSGRRAIHNSTMAFRATLPPRGIPQDVEIHASVWVSEKDKFPGTNAFTRISALGDYLRRCSKCRGVQVVNILVDTSLPGPAGTNVRERIWENLFWSFEVFLAGRRCHGHSILDRGAVAQVAAIARRLQKGSLKWQRTSPEPRHSHSECALQLADVCAYFMLQQISPCNQVRNAGATNYIDRVARLCPSDRDPHIAHVRDLQ